MVIVSVTFGMTEETSQLGANEVTAGQNLRSFMACGKSGSFISFICCGIFMFFTAETARAGAAVIPACTHMDGRSVENGQYQEDSVNAKVEILAGNEGK